MSVVDPATLGPADFVHCATDNAPVMLHGADGHGVLPPR
jgi:hypothetical protein